jgi:adiponectin receptor
VSCGLFAIVPLFHMEYFMDSIYLDNFIMFPWVLGGAIYILGAIIYMLKIPERFKPGKFDLFVIILNSFHLGLITQYISFYDCICIFNTL